MARLRRNSPRRCSWYALLGLLAPACAFDGARPRDLRDAGPTPLVRGYFDQEEAGQAPDPYDEQAEAEGEVQAGPDGVLQNIEEDATQESVYAFLLRPLERYSRWKERLQEEHGLAFGLRFQTLYQHSSDVLEGDRDGFGHLIRLQGVWWATGRDTGSPGRLEWRLEARDALGGYRAPAELSVASGAASLNTATPYSADWDLDLDVLSWVQGFRDRRIGLAVGRLAFTAHLDPSFLQRISSALLNRAFFLNPTLGTTGIGALGAVAKARLGEHMWTGAQIYDANAINGDFDLDTLREGEWLTAVELGWSPSVERGARNLVQLTYWNKDELEERDVRSGSGWLFTSTWDLTEGFSPFARAGFSNGGGGARAEASASVGFECSLGRGNTWGLGAGWARPSSKTFSEDLDDEYVLETSYEVQVSRNLSFMPDVQLLIDPALNPDESSVWVLGLRMILSL